MAFSLEPEDSQLMLAAHGAGLNTEIASFDLESWCLPIGAFGAVEDIGLGFGAHVVDVVVAPVCAIRVVLHSAEIPFDPASHGVFRNARQKRNLLFSFECRMIPCAKLVKDREYYVERRRYVTKIPKKDLMAIRMLLRGLPLPELAV